MKKVLFLGRFPPPVHGAAVMNQNYFEALNKDKDFNVKKIKINYSDSLDELGKVNFKKFFGFFVVFLKTLFNLIFFRPNVVYFELAPKGFAFYRDSAYVILCKIFRRKIVFHFQAKGVINLKKRKLSKAYAKFILKNTHAILLSSLLYYDLEGFIPKKNIFIVPNAIKDEITDKQFNEIIKNRHKNKKPALLYLSNMIESKGPLDVLRICNELRNQKKDFECLFVGSFQDSEFEKRFFKEIKNLNLEKYCKYLGPKYGKEKFEILEKTNYLIFPTQYPEECFPLVILEAFMLGIPVFGYENGATKEIISRELLGHVAKKGDWKELSKQLTNRFNNKGHPKEIREEFKKNYVLDISVKKVRRILK
jgi:glycosyltransferase involved in cell wall biosynthesis